jgi:diguanylate cyclase (GGDEF)-like protein
MIGKSLVGMPAPNIRRLALAVVGLTVLLPIANFLPAARFFTPVSYLPWHTAFEFIAMVVSLMVFALGWNLRREKLNSHIILLAAAFFAVAVIDFAHAMTYPGMPSSLGESGLQLTIDFWLAGRAIAALALLAVALLPLRTWKPGTAVAALGAALAVSALVWWISLVHGDWLPANITPSGGLSGFKVDAEYVLAATYFVASLLMLRQRNNWNDPNLCFLAAGAWVLGLAELMFTLYTSPSDLFNVFGHLYKATAYAMLYRALFVSRVIAPYQALEQSKAELAHLANHDSLTGLPNRRMIESCATALLDDAGRTRGSLMLLDLDAFKDVNDSLGHAAGDELLRLVANRLQSRLPRGALLGRVGGDEFVVLAADLFESADVVKLAEQLIQALKLPFVLNGGQELYIGTSIGICRLPDDGSTVDQVVRNADAALYEAKEASRGGFRFYSPALTEAANKRMSLESRLRRGLERNEFLLHYQPLVNAVDGRIAGVEALLRWAPPGEALVPAGAFIKVAEDAGLSIALGEWVLREACRQMADWHKEGLRLDLMAVNLSSQQFHHTDIAVTIAEALALSGLAPQALEIEITEGSLMGGGTDVEATLAALKKIGVKLAIDDFGTGYSSLAYLKRFPVDKLKVDQSFVRDIPNDAKGMQICEVVVNLGKILGLEVLAEGVETEAQLAYLRGLGCDYMQGYLLGRPMPAAEIEAQLRGNAAALERLKIIAGAPQSGQAAVSAARKSNLQR